VSTFLTAIRRSPGRSVTVLVLLGLILFAAGIIGVQLDASYHLQAARQALQHYRLEDAHHHLVRCMSVRGTDPEVLLLAARAARRAASFDEADYFLEEYRRLHGRTDELVMEQTLLKAERGDVDEVSLFGYTKVKERDPAAPLILEAFIQGYARLFRMREAEACVQEWKRFDPDNPMLYRLEGLVHEYAERQGAAIASYRRTLELDPAFDEARMRLVFHLLQLGQGKDAIAHAEYLVSRRPSDPLGHVYLARCQDQLGQQAEAERILDEILKTRPAFAPALFERGKLALRARELDRAEELLERASRLDPSDLQIQYQLYVCLSHAGKTERAKEVNARLKQIEEDLRQLQEITLGKMDRFPDDPGPRCEAGRIALRAGALKEALDWFKRALQVDAHHKPTHRALAELYFKMGEPGRAAFHRERAREEPSLTREVPPPPLKK
jgi:tetratricopeptide (TPR) repeat protein